VRLHRDWQTVGGLVGTALSRLDGQLCGRRLDVALPAELPPVHVDAPLVTQVIVNLLENAVKHAPQGTRIQISAALEGDSVSVIVEDNGPGLPKGDPETLFARFQRGREESNVVGAGVGLAICRAVINAHSRRISAAPRIGGGARFTFTLPITEPAE
jgi:two-component system sensor histidine kinase KdpD